MFESPFDVLEEPDFKELYPAALEDGLEELRRGSFFHTKDLVESVAVREAHRWHSYDPGFQSTVEQWLVRHAFRLGVQGPLAGHDELGLRWAFYDEAASPRES